MPKGLAQFGSGLYATRARDQRLGPAPPGSGDRGLLRSGAVPCLLTVLWLTAHQQAGRGADMDLAAALVRAGHLARAVELVRACAGRSGPEEDLVRLVRTAGEAGDLDYARALAGSLTDRTQRDRALVARIPAVARAGDHKRILGGSGQAVVRTPERTVGRSLFRLTVSVPAGTLAEAFPSCGPLQRLGASEVQHGGAVQGLP
ncbi:hypothetical protein ACFV4G_42575 [Kitasatospora sp. NPDC059747]|uniref:hypothetical protein n=1 Tax=Kitasatospora sp. NPDC059747 TaxID=3346930 RepID=UPI00365BE302